MNYGFIAENTLTNDGKGGKGRKMWFKADRCQLLCKKANHYRFVCNLLQNSDLQIKGCCNLVLWAVLIWIISLSPFVLIQTPERFTSSFQKWNHALQNMTSRPGVPESHTPVSGHIGCEGPSETAWLACLLTTGLDSQWTVQQVHVLFPRTWEASHMLGSGRNRRWKFTMSCFLERRGGGWRGLWERRKGGITAGQRHNVRLTNGVHHRKPPHPVVGIVRLHGDKSACRVTAFAPITFFFFSFSLSVSLLHTQTHTSIHSTFKTGKTSCSSF